VRNDISQAEALLEVLFEDRREDVRSAWNDAIRRGKKWCASLHAGAEALFETAYLGKQFAPRSILTTIAARAPERFGADHLSMVLAGQFLISRADRKQFQTPNF